MTRPTMAVARARRILARRGAWIEAFAGAYLVRGGVDRRARVLQQLEEAEFRQLVEEPGLKLRTGGGWIARAASTARTSPSPGRPGVVDGVRVLAGPDGVSETRRANLASSPVAWLAARCGPDGQPWLTRADVAAAEQLGLDAEAALGGASVTMRWDTLPRAGAGRGPDLRGPSDRALAASRRLEAALAACGSARAMVEQVCIQASALQAAEQTLGLRRRTGRAVLKAGLSALARHYRLM